MQVPLEAAQSNGTIETRVIRLERTIYGHLDENTNQYVDGLLQIARDTRNYVHFGAYGISLILALSVALVTHQFGWAGTILHTILGFAP